MPSMNIRLQDWQHEQLVRQAKDNGRSIHGQILWLLFQAARSESAEATERAVTPESNARGERAAERESTVLDERAGASESTGSRKRLRRVRCEHRIPAGSFCKICDA